MSTLTHKISDRMLLIERWRALAPREFVVMTIVGLFAPLTPLPLETDVKIAFNLNFLPSIYVWRIHSGSADSAQVYAQVHNIPVMRGWVAENRPELLEMFDAAVTIAMIRREQA